MKITKILLIITSIIWTAMNFVTVISSPNVVNLTSFIGIVPIITALYTEIDYLYITCNKLRAYFLLRTVNFVPKSSIYLNIDSIDVDDDKLSKLHQSLEKRMRDILKELKYSIDESEVHRSREDLRLYIESCHSLKSVLTVNLHPEKEHVRLVLKMDNQVAYRDVMEKWKEFLLLQQKLFSEFSKTTSRKERFDVTIKTDRMKKYNPFYRLTVRHIGSPTVKRFELKFNDDSLSITTNMNKIYATSDNYQDIEKVLKEYVPLSRLN